MVLKIAYLFSGLLVAALALRGFVLDPAWQRAKDGHKLSRWEKLLVTCWTYSSVVIYILGILTICAGSVYSVMCLIRASVR